MVGGHPGPQRKVEEVGAHSPVVVEEVEVLHLEGEVEVVVGGCRHGQEGEEEVVVVGERHQAEVEEVEVEEAALLRPLVEVELRVQLDLLRSANMEQKH